MVISVDIFRPRQTFIRVDSQGDTVTQLQQFSRSLSQRPEMTHQDITDRTFLSFVSKLTTQMFRYSLE